MKLIKTIQNCEHTIDQINQENNQIKFDFTTLKDRLMIEFEQKEKELII